MGHLRSGHVLAALTAAAVLLAAPPSGVAARQQAAAGSDPSTRISGPWRLNTDLSTKPPAPGDVPSTPPSDPNGGAAGRPAPGGGYGGGRGGMGGGYGGGYRTRGTNRAGTNAAQATEIRSLFRELTSAPAGLTIVVSGAMVETTDSDGLIRKFTVDGTKETLDMDAAQVGVTSKWRGNILDQDFEIGSQRIERTIQTSDDDSQLIVNITPIGPATTASAPGASAPRTAGVVRLVYDRN